MKKLLIFGVVFILLIVSCNHLLGERIAKVSVSQSKGFYEVNTTFFVTYEDKASINIVAKAITDAKREPGIVNMVTPEYDVEVIYANGEKVYYYLWLDKNVSTVMHMNDTHTIYSLEGKQNVQLVELLSKHVE